MRSRIVLRFVLDRARVLSAGGPGVGGTTSMAGLLSGGRGDPAGVGHRLRRTSWKRDRFAAAAAAGGSEAGAAMGGGGDSGVVERAMGIVPRLSSKPPPPLPLTRALLTCTMVRVPSEVCEEVLLASRAAGGARSDLSVSGSDGGYGSGDDDSVVAGPATPKLLLLSRPPPRRGAPSP